MSLGVRKGVPWGGHRYFCKEKTCFKCFVRFLDVSTHPFPFQLFHQRLKLDSKQFAEWQDRRYYENSKPPIFRNWRALGSLVEVLYRTKFEDEKTAAL